MYKNEIKEWKHMQEIILRKIKCIKQCMQINTQMKENMHEKKTCTLNSYSRK